MKKKIAILAFAATTVLTSTIMVNKSETVKAASSKVSFFDIRGHWAEQAINGAIQKGYVDGYPDDSFKPEGQVTRAEFIKMVDNALNVSVGIAGAGDAWYIPYINAAVTSGFLQWSDVTSGDWNTPMTRKDLARVAVRSTTGDKNTDDQKWMYLATKAGLITGMDDTGTLGEDKTTTRSQSVTIIERILSIKNGQTLSFDKHAVSRAEVAWHGTNIFTMWPRYFPDSFMDRFDMSKAKWDSSDGIYHEQLVEFVIVDMEDASDPFRNEVDGMTFDFQKNDANGKPLKTETLPAPTKSYVTFSKVKQSLTSEYPKGMYATEGGSAVLSGLGIGPSVNQKEWKTKYSTQENKDTILFTKNQNAQNTVNLNIKRGNNPYDPTYLVAGKTYYWTTGMVHPKGDMFSDTLSFLVFMPAAYYSTISGTNKGVTFATAKPNYNVVNP
ncbi:hypothetical protein GCM10008018_72470 [Paenibacillus marchantiophytorum]|uniref:SLH domain-containing protein n=1 Tax=Paenibacillus marchantiophytorum TaxID=1619310 RepID=A0ABQ1FJN0_9BACL|nr:S-layer homology domain-containing protein [Paenibacillus marchantiophytorum]GGA17882.1 hypothetical protein GCM10008018_72470 [Paenibacillus marchantiophytorum]